MKTSQPGLDLIKRYEGCRLKAYRDSVGVWTIGYGHTRGVKKGDTATKKQVEAWLVDDVVDAENAVDRGIAVDLKQPQFDALVSAAFNLGPKVVTPKHSTLARKLNAGDRLEVPTQLLRWCRADGKRSLGLLRRRVAEAALFLGK